MELACGDGSINDNKEDGDFENDKMGAGGNNNPMVIVYLFPEYIGQTVSYKPKGLKLNKSK